VIRIIEASPNRLSVTGIADPHGAKGVLNMRSLFKAYSKSWDGLFCYRGPTPIVFLIFFKMAGVIGEGNKEKAFHYTP
jgi:hypothetical protein